MSEADTPVEATDRAARLAAEAEAARRRGSWDRAATGFADAARVSASRGHRHELLLRAADCHVRGGALGRGWSTLAGLLDEHGVQLPSSPVRAKLGATWRRGRFLLSEQLGGETQAPTPSDELRLTVLDAAARSLTLVNPALADALRTLHLREVGRYGRASDRCRALAGEIAMLTRKAAFDRSVKRLLERCAELARATDEPLDEGWRLLAVASCEFSHGRWRSCVEACERASAIFASLADVGVDIDHERSRVTALHWFALAWLGELDELRGRLERAVLTAEAHKDALMLLEALTGQAALVWLASDEIGPARSRAVELLSRHRAIEGASWPESAYRRQQYRDLMAEVHACLYRGEPSPAWAALVGAWRQLDGADYLPMRTLGVEIRSARARVGLALAEQFDRDAELAHARLHAQPGLASQTWDRPRLLADVELQIEGMRRDEHCVTPAMRSLLQAGVDNLAGRRDDAQINLDAAMRAFDSVDMALHRECARYALGELIGGGEGGRMQDQAETWMRRRGVVHPRKLAASQAPGLALA